MQFYEIQIANYFKYTRLKKRLTQKKKKEEESTLELIAFSSNLRTYDSILHAFAFSFHFLLHWSNLSLIQVTEQATCILLIGARGVEPCIGGGGGLSKWRIALSSGKYGANDAWRNSINWLRLHSHICRFVFTPIASHDQPRRQDDGWIDVNEIIAWRDLD